MTPLAEQRDRIVAGWRDSELAESPGAPPWLAPIRRAAIDRFQALGFPSRKREDWKYTNVTQVADFLAASVDRPQPAPEPAVGEVETAELAHALVFVDGRYDAARSHLSALPSGVVIDSLAKASAQQPELVESLLARAADSDDRAFVALNTALQRDGALVWLPADVSVPEPIHILFVGTCAANQHAIHPLNVIHIGAGASATVVVRHVSHDDTAYTKNVVGDIELGDAASLHYVGLELESATAFHVGTLNVRIGRDAHFTSHAVSLGARLARHEIHAVLGGTGAECDLNGVYLASGERHVDNQTLVDHVQPHGTSRELYKGILGGRSRGVFNGTVIVRPDAQKTRAEQSNPNLLVSGAAEVDTRPNLEIHADDVKCTHGSTVGRLDEDALFFLRARGIEERSARRMLGHAFASEVIDRIPDAPLRESVGRIVDAALQAAEGETE